MWHGLSSKRLRGQLRWHIGWKRNGSTSVLILEHKPRSKINICSLSALSPGAVEALSLLTVGSGEGGRYPVMKSLCLTVGCTKFSRINVTDIVVALSWPSSSGALFFFSGY